MLGTIDSQESKLPQEPRITPPAVQLPFSCSDFQSRGKVYFSRDVLQLCSPLPEKAPQICVKLNSTSDCIKGDSATHRKYPQCGTAH
jgi:hypothetical protein